MIFEEVRSFLETNHDGGLVTFRKNGAAQMSLVTCGVFQDGVACTTTGNRAKLANLRRDPRCTILISKPDRSDYLVVEGSASIRSSDNTDGEKLRLILRKVYQACAGRDHPDWDDYDRAMVEQGRAAIKVIPHSIYGMGP